MSPIFGSPRRRGRSTAPQRGREASTWKAPTDSSSSATCNTGTKLPELEIPTTRIDYCAGRSVEEPGRFLEILSPLFGSKASVVLRSRGRGRLGFTDSANLKVDGILIGWVLWGGESQRGWIHLDMTGRGCSRVIDWGLADASLCSMRNWQYRRVDIAVDTFGGESSHADVLSSHRHGAFNTGGRPPALRQIGVRSRDDGTTIYVGCRERGKLFRSYDKYLQLTKAGEVERTTLRPSWYRIELELKAKFSPLPQDVIACRDRYFAEAYPYNEEVLSRLHQRRAFELAMLEVP